MPNPALGSGGGGLFNGLTSRRQTQFPSTNLCATQRLAVPYIEPAPANTFAIVNQVGTQVMHLGAGVYSVEKTAGASGYNADAISTVGITGDFVLRMKALTFTSSNYYGGGMNTDPTLDQNYNSVDWLSLCAPSLNRWDLYEDGSLQVTGAATNADYVWIWRLGSTLYHGHGADLATAQVTPDRTVTDGSTLYFDSAFTDLGDRLEVLLYTPPLALAAAVGAYTLTGTPTALSRTRALVAAPGSYALTGTATGLKAGRRVAATPGSYSLTGAALQFRAARKLVATPGSYAFTGIATGLKAARRLAANVGGYALSGTATGLKKGYTLPAAPGSYALSGVAAALRVARRLAETIGSYSLTGTNTAVRASRRLPAAPGAYSLTGSPVGLTYGPVTSSFVLTAVPGAYSLTGNVTVLRVGRVIRIVSGAYVLTGNDADLIYDPVWDVVAPSNPVFVNDNPEETIWTELAEAGGIYDETQPNTGIWTVTPPNSGTWG